MTKILIINDKKSAVSNKKEENLHINIKQLELDEKTHRKLEALINIFNMANIIGYSQLNTDSLVEGVFNNLLKSKAHIANLKLRHCKRLQNQQDFMHNFFGENWTDISIIKEYLKSGDYLAYSSMAIELLYFNVLPTIQNILTKVDCKKIQQNKLQEINEFIAAEREKITFSILSRMKNTILAHNLTNDDALFAVNHTLCELNANYSNWHTAIQNKYPYHNKPYYGIKRNTWLNFHNALLCSHQAVIKEEYIKLWEKITHHEQLIPLQVIYTQDKVKIFPILEGLEKKFLLDKKAIGPFEIGRKIINQYFTDNFYEFNEINFNFSQLRQKINDIQTFPGNERVSIILYEFNVLEKTINSAKVIAQKSKVHGVVGKLFFRKTNYLLDIWIDRLDTIKTQQLALLKNELLQKVTRNLPAALRSIGQKLLQEDQENLDVFFEGIFNFAVSLDNRFYDKKIIVFIEGIKENINSVYFFKLKQLIHGENTLSYLNKLRRLQNFNEDSLNIFKVGFLEQLYIDNEFCSWLVELPMVELNKLSGKFQALSAELPNSNPLHQVFQVLGKLSVAAGNSNPINFLLAEHGKLIDCFQLFQQFNNYLNQILTCNVNEVVQFNQRYLDIFRTHYFNQDYLPFWRQWLDRLMTQNKFTLLPLEIKTELLNKLGKIDLIDEVEKLPQKMQLIKPHKFDELTDKYAGDFAGIDELSELWRHIVCFDAMKLVNNFNMEQQNSFYRFCEKFSEKCSKPNALSSINGYKKSELSKCLQSDMTNGVALFVDMDLCGKNNSAQFYKKIFKIHRFYLIGKLYGYKEKNNSNSFFKDKNIEKFFSTTLEVLDQYYYRIQGSEIECDIFRLINECWLDVQNNVFLTKSSKKIVAEFYKDFGIHEFLDEFARKNNCIPNFTRETRTI